VLDRFFREAQHFGKAGARKELDVEDFFNGGLEIDVGDDRAAADIDHGDPDFNSPAGSFTACSSTYSPMRCTLVT
jgi:hypothetical protein